MSKSLVRPVLLLLLFGLSSVAWADPPAPKDFAKIKLKGAGLSPELAQAIDKAYSPDELNRIVELNVLGFLGKADYSVHYNKKALRKCREFIRKYGRSLRHVQSAYKVPKEVVAALLWVETQHGTRLGKYKVLNVLFSLLQADHPEVVSSTMAALSQREPASVSEYRQKVIERSQAKAQWAMDELLSLDKFHAKNKRSIASVKGSYAGAFGIPQFIPSSYIKWARTRKKDRQADLFRMGDAIHSVGFYLNSNGWNPKDPVAQRGALFHYNRADGYVDVILKLAEELAKPRPSH